MMKNTLYVLLVAALLAAVSCKSNADKKLPDMAKDVCNCLSQLEREMSAEARNVIIGASTVKGEENMKQKMQADMAALPDEKKMDVAKELMSLGEKMQSKTSGVGECMERMEKKYKNLRTLDSNRELWEKFAKELRNQNCTFAASVMQIAANK